MSLVKSFKSLAFGAIAATSSLAIGATALANHTGFAVTQDGSSIVLFDPTDPSATTVVTLTGDTSRLDALDIRPDTGKLIGYDSASDRYFNVDPFTGETTQIDDGMAVPVQQSVANDIDWNPTIDRMRLVTAQDDNIVFNPNNGATTRVNDLFYVPGDVNFGADPTVIGNAYTNSFAENFGGTTTQYVLDAGTDSLGILANNAGEITTVGALTLDGSPVFFGVNGGFDIFYDRDEEENIAYALLAGVSGVSTLYIVDLASGALEQIGTFSTEFGALRGLAFGVLEEIPLPAAAWIFLAGVAGLSFARKSRR